MGVNVAPVIWNTYEVAKKVTFARSCDRCGHRYFVNARVVLSVTTRHTETSQRIGEKDIDELTRRIKYSEHWGRNVGVLCPGCGQFSQRAMADHFPHGYADGLARKHAANGALAVPLVCFFAAWLPPVFILAFCLPRGIRVGQSFWFLTTAWVILLSLLVVIDYLMRRRGCSKIRAIGAELSEEELHAVVVEHYLRSCLSLRMAPSPKRLQQFARSPTTSFRLPSPDLVVSADGENRCPGPYFDTGAHDLELRRKLADLGVKRLVCFFLAFFFGWAGCGLLLGVAIWPESMAEETTMLVCLCIGAALMTLAGFSYAAFLGRLWSGWLMWVVTPISLLLLRDRHRRKARELEGQLTIEGRQAYAFQRAVDLQPDRWDAVRRLGLNELPPPRVRKGLFAGVMWLCFSVASLVLLFVTVREPAEYLFRELASGENGMGRVEALFSAWEREEDNVRDFFRALFVVAEPEEDRGANESPGVGSEEGDQGPDAQAPSESVAATGPDHDEAPVSDNFRLWTDATGEHSTEAVFVEHEGGKITLRNRDGRVIEVLVESLSDEDQEWLRKVKADDSQGIEPGSVVVVLGEDVEVMLGNETIAHLAKGAKVTATEVRDEWVGVNVESEGKTMRGWVPREEIEPSRHR